MIGLAAVPASAATTLRLTVSGLPSGATAEAAARPYVGGAATAASSATVSGEVATVALPALTVGVWAVQVRLTAAGEVVSFWATLPVSSSDFAAVTPPPTALREAAADWPARAARAPSAGYWSVTEGDTLAVTVTLAGDDDLAGAAVVARSGDVTGSGALVSASARTVSASFAAAALAAGLRVIEMQARGAAVLHPAFGTVDVRASILAAQPAESSALLWGGSPLLWGGSALKW